MRDPGEIELLRGPLSCRSMSSGTCRTVMPMDIERVIRFLDQPEEAARWFTSLGLEDARRACQEPGGHRPLGHDTRPAGRDLHSARAASAAHQRSRHGAEQPGSLRRGRPQSAVAGLACSSGTTSRCRRCCRSSPPASTCPTGWCATRKRSTLLRLTEGQPVSREALRDDICSEVAAVDDERVVTRILAASGTARRCGSPTATSCGASRWRPSRRRSPTWPTRSSRPPCGSAWRFQPQKRGMPRLPDGQRARFVVLALGKLGGVELNYSSDIDLIFLSDGDGKTDGERPVSNVGVLRPPGQADRQAADRAHRLGHRLSRRPAAAAGGQPGARRDGLGERAALLRHVGPHLGTAGVRQGPPGRRRPGPGRDFLGTAASPGSIAAT